MSTQHAVSFTHEELSELQGILESHLKLTLIEIRRSTPNSDGRHYLSHRLEVIRKLLVSVEQADHTQVVSTNSP